MNVFSLSEADAAGYYLRFLEAIRMPQRTGAPAFSSLGYPKKQDMILYVDGCSTQYVTKDSRILTTEDGDVVYVPRGAQYRVCCLEEKESSATLQINFLLFRESMEPFVFSEDIIIFKRTSKQLRELFERAVLNSRSARVSPIMQKTLLLELLHKLAEQENDRIEASVIQRGIEHLLLHYHEDPSVTELSQMCHVSEEYFRRLFKQQMGESPTAYKNKLRMQRAVQYLKYTDMPIAQISESLGYATVSHFIKAFKEIQGCSPLSFRHAYSI